MINGWPGALLCPQLSLLAAAFVLSHRLALRRPLPGPDQSGASASLSLRAVSARARRDGGRRRHAWYPLMETPSTRHMVATA